MVPSLATWAEAEEMTVLVTVKAYPEVSAAYGETVCVAGIRVDREPFEFVRLFPVTYRGLSRELQFEKYQLVRLRAVKHSGDRRLESYRPNLDTIEIIEAVSAGGTWAQRRAYVEPLLGPTMCQLNEGRRGGMNGPSLGVVRPASVRAVTVEVADDWSDGQLAIVNQGSLLQQDRIPLEQIGHRFRYRWTCSEPGCAGHHQKIADWELGAAYRSWRRNGEPPITQIREKWLDEMCGPEREPAFFVGDIAQHPGSFMVLGTFWPKRRPNQAQLTLELAA